MTEQRRIMGFIEVLGADKVTGWCFDTTAPEEPVALELLVRGQPVAQAVTAIDRQDVARAHSCRRFCGFEFPRSREWMAASLADITIRVRGSAQVLSMLGAGPAAPPPPPRKAATERRPPPKVPALASIDRAAAAALLATPLPWDDETDGTAAEPGVLDGAIEEVREGVALGWAWRPGAGPVRLGFRLDGAAIGEAVANTPRASGRADGFALPLPPAAHDGAPHRLTAHEIGSGQMLPGEGLVVQLGPPGLWRLRRGLAELRLRPGARAAVRLEWLVDGQALAGPTVTRTAPDQALLLPEAALDGAPHLLALRDAETGALLDGPVAAEVTATASGKVERFAQGIVSGHAADPRTPERPVAVTLLADGEPVAETRTGPGGAFTLVLPRTLLDGTPHRLGVLAENVALGLDGAAEFTLAANAGFGEFDAGRFRGRLEQAQPERVSGWAVDMAAPDCPVTVAIELDGVVVATVLADRYEARLRGLSGGGQHGFAWTPPTGCWNGRERVLGARIIGAEAPLEGSPATLRLPARVLALPPPKPPLPFRPALAPAPGLVSAIVLNRNGAELLEALFASLARHVAWPLEVVLIDHGSTDASLAVAARWQERLALRVEARGANFSYSASNNLGARLARGHHLLFLNNDIVLTQDPLPAMLRCLGAEGVIAAGARLVEPVAQADGSMRPVLHHDGIGFRLLHGGALGRSEWLAEELAGADADPAAGPGEAAALTAALLLVRRADFLRLGGFDEGYDYGLEDVDLCLRLGREGRLAMARDAVALHQRSATRGQRFAAAQADPEQAATPARELANRTHFQRRQGPWLKRRLRHAALTGESAWRPPFRIGFAASAAPRDALLAAGLGAALAETEGWEAVLLPPGETDARGLDAVVALHPTAPLRALVNATPGLLLLAWVHDKVDEWLGAGEWDRFAAICATSAPAAAALAAASGEAVCLLPPAATAVRPRPLDPAPVLWADHAPDLALPAIAGLAIRGEGWGRVAAAEPHWLGTGGPPDAALVLMPSAAAARRWALPEPRWFEAAAAGALVLADDPAASALIPELPAAADLDTLAARFMGDREALADATKRLGEALAAGHLWTHRAPLLAAALRAAADRLRVAVKVPAGEEEVGEALARAARALGHAARVDRHGQWLDGLTAGDDVALVPPASQDWSPDARCLELPWPARPEELAARLAPTEAMLSFGGQRAEPAASKKKER